MKLNDPIIKAAKPKDKPYKLTDGKALVLLINPNGSKWWRYRYIFNGKEKMLSFGVYPDVTLAKARELHKEARELVKQGIDPSQYRQEQKLVKKLAIQNTFESVARRWWQNWQANKTERHATIIFSRLEKDVFPVIGSKPIADISAPILIMALNKTVERGAVNTAKRLFSYCSRIFSYAISHSLAERNPCSDVFIEDIFPPTETKNFKRISEGDLPELIAKIEAYTGALLTKYALQFLLLTFVRTGELLGARWDEIDQDAKLWRIPAERMKKRTPHLVPLSKQALALLEKIKEQSSCSQLLFPNVRDKSRPMSNNTMLHALYYIGFKGQMTGHGFRGLASTCLNEKGFPQKIIELQLAHLTGNATQRAYDHAKHLSERAQMMQAWADYLEGLK
jgi:integrase